MVSFTSVLVLLLASTALSHKCLSDDEAYSLSQRWLAIWGTNYITKIRQLKPLVTKDVVNYDATFGSVNVGIDALFAAATFVDPLVTDVLQKPEWVFHDCDQIGVRWSYTAVSTGVGSTKPKGTPIYLEGIEILKVKLDSRLIFNATSSADWILLARQLGQTVDV